MFMLAIAQVSGDVLLPVELERRVGFARAQIHLFFESQSGT